MPNKTQEYLNLAQQTAKELTRYWENWTDYLTTASRLYKYNYADQLMIYAQRPDATACASFDLWNDRMNRYVRRGSKGIALLDQSSSVPRLHYVFDVSDTGVRRNSRDPEVWQLGPDLMQPVSEMLAREYGVQQENLGQQIADICGRLVDSYWDNNSGDILDIVDGSFLMDYDEAGQEFQFKSAAAISITYAVLERCGFEPEGHFDRDDFQAIFSFSTPAAVYALGTAVSECSRDVLRNIERTVKTTIRRRNVERSQYEYEQQERDLLDRRGLPAPEPDPEPAPEAAGQVRQAAPDVPDEPSPGAVQHDAPEREPVPAPDGGGADGREPDAADHAGTAEAEPGSEQRAASDGVGAAHEQPESTGRGTGDERADLQLSFFDTHIPTEAKQIESIDQAESEKSPSAFSLSQADIENALRRGSNFENSKLRIWKIYQLQPDRNLRAKALAKEYAPNGPGGSSHTYLDGSRGWLDHDSKGLTFEHYPDHQKILLRWNQVEKYIDLMIQSDRYLSDKEKRIIDFPLELNDTSAAEYTALKEQYPDTLIGFEAGGNFMFYGEDAAKVAKIINSALFMRNTALGEVQITGFLPSLWAKRAKELWSAGNDVYLAGLNEDGTHHQTKHLRKEDYLPIGSVINMDDRKFRVDSVDFDKDKVSLQDMALADARMPIFREEPLTVVRELYEQQDEALDTAPEKTPDYNVGDSVVVDLPTRTIEGTIGYVGETDVRIDTSAQGYSWSNEVLNKQQFEDGLRQDEPELSDEELDKLPTSVEVNGEWQTFPDAAAADKALNAEPVPEAAGNFHITDDHLGEGGAKQKYARNVEAIRTLFQLEQEHRGATAEEQQILSQYVGWGGLPDVFDPDKGNWAKEYSELKGLLSEDEYAAARSSVLNAHYTSPTVIRAIYDAVEKMGFRNGNILEPSMGIGNFFGMLPDTMQDSRLYGVELDSVTGRIAQKLYPDAFIIATHTDREHIHNHIIYNSTALDSTRKFRDFLLSGLAVQRLSDLICLEHQLSVIEIKPYRERQKRTLYPPRESNRDKLCAVIDNILLSEKPASFEGFLQKLEQRGYEIKRGKYTSVKGTRQKRFIRFRTLGAGYSEDEIKAVIAGDAEHCPHQKQPPKEKPFNLLVDVQAKLAEGKNIGYARWAKKYNLKEMSKTLIFLQEKKIGSIEEMQERVDAATARYHELGDSIKAAETRMTEIAVLRTHIVNYTKTRPVYDAYRKAGYSKRFLENHRAEITLHKAAKTAFDEAKLKKLPKVKELDAEYSKLLTEKKAAYPDYRKAKDEMQELLRAQRNVELFFAEEKNTTEKTQSR